MDGSDYVDSTHFHFDLALPSSGLKIGHWNVNRLTSAKLDQIKLYLSKKDGKPQVDIMFLNETFLKPNVYDFLFNVNGFDIFRRDRSQKGGGGVMGYVNAELKVKRRTDLERFHLEIISLEVCPFKSHRHKPRKNIESAYLLNKKTIVLGDFNIDSSKKKKSTFNKHRLTVGLRSMHFHQLVNFVTRPICGTILDHVYTNHSHHIVNVCFRDIGLADHLPVFVTRKYHRSKEAIGRKRIAYVLNVLLADVSIHG